MSWWQPTDWCEVTGPGTAILGRRSRAATSATYSALLRRPASTTTVAADRAAMSRFRATSRVRDGLLPGGYSLTTNPTAANLQGKQAGAWPAVRAVLDPSVRGGQMWGPWMLGLRGKPRLEPVHGQLADTTLAARVWAASVDLTGVDPGLSTGQDRQGAVIRKLITNSPAQAMAANTLSCRIEREGGPGA